MTSQIHSAAAGEMRRPPLPASLLKSVAVLMVCGGFGGCDRSQMSGNGNSYPSRIEALATHHAISDPLAQSQQRGHVVYEHYCQICHGEHGQGDGFNSAMLNPSPRNFTDESFWKHTSEEKLATVIAGGGKSADESNLMPAWSHTLDPKQIRDVIAYLRTLPKEARQLQSQQDIPEK